MCFSFVISLHVSTPVVWNSSGACPEEHWDLQLFGGSRDVCPRSRYPDDTQPSSLLAHGSPLAFSRSFL